MTAVAYPIYVFQFELELDGVALKPSMVIDPVQVAAFAECTGLEATMEPKVIKEGGRNYGAIQRPGPVTFATVILKRGITIDTQLWEWFERTSRGGFTERQDVTIRVKSGNGDALDVVVWKLTRALPIKFKAADLNAKGSEIGIEELHLAHEGLSMEGATP